ncbi:MAG: S41 family peptidase, partial [Bacteroidota bacterium]
TPLTALQFRHKLLHILSGIGDGHITLQLNRDKIPADDMLFFSGDKEYPIQQLSYKIINGRLYVSKNTSGNNTILPGAEILSIDNKSALELIANFSGEMPSDGYNQTFKIGQLNLNEFPSLYYFTYGLKERLTFTIKQKDSIKTCELTVHNRQKSTAAIAHFDSANIDIPFDDKAALIKISRFVWFDADNDPFIDAFTQIKNLGIKCLIIDLRDNIGGDFTRMARLFSYLISKPTLLGNLKMGALNSTHEAGKNEIEYGYKRPIQPDSNHFDGKLYVIMNGASFSASSLFAASLQANNRATLVGEETGGGRNGCIGGVYDNSTLPNSNLLFKFGLCHFNVSHQVTQLGRGVMPDAPITYTINDYLSTRDMEREWIDNDIKAKSILKQ